MKLLKKLRWKLMPKKNELLKTLQKTWDNFGKKDPYFSVITDDKYKDENLSDKVIEEFYLCDNAKACTKYINQKLKEHAKISLNHFRDKTALDFGCGVGRNIVHLAPQFKSVTGLDISQGHLDRAKKVCEKMNITNVQFHKSYEEIESFGKFDLAFTVITLQHTPPPLMKSYIKQLLNMLNPGGFAFIHLPVGRAKGYKYNEEKCISDQEILSWQMHLLPQKVVQKIIDSCNCKLIEFDNTVDHCGVDWDNGFFIIQKKS